MLPFLRKIQRNLHDYGIRQTVAKVCLGISSPLFHSRTYRLYRADLRSLRMPPRKDLSLTFRFLTDKDKDCLRQILQMEEWLHGRLEEILQQGGLCLVAMDGSTVAGFNLVAFDAIHIPVVHYARRLRGRQAFSIQITVHRAYRGRGLGSSLRQEILRALQEQGVRYFYGGTDIHNEANLALSRKVGLKEIADVCYRKILWRERTIVQRVSR
jgi:ribosomal protein S18 acetylase RimI-like enzyme